ncbi:hypothetical protein PV327_009549 [Microctonus hyperodae]|uniref:Uncharacterized protein n=1 Tax=Microctonus hyperodae TaxID=165561 RepID=A0AA39CAP6_MICHY|nr:hypothetical protein PV327_009549 [Microctonus hyperodae]
MKIVSLKFYVIILFIITILIRNINSVSIGNESERYNALVKFGAKVFDIIEKKNLSDVNLLYHDLTQVFESNQFIQDVEITWNIMSNNIKNIDKCLNMILYKYQVQNLFGKFEPFENIHDIYENNFIMMLKYLSENKNESLSNAKNKFKYNIGSIESYLNNTLYTPFICAVEPIFLSLNQKIIKNSCRGKYNLREYKLFSETLILNYIKNMTMILFNLKFIDKGNNITLLRHFLMEEYNTTLSRVFLLITQNPTIACELL